jgi:putative spermidine/putrescine transport system permease protein
LPYLINTLLSDLRHSDLATLERAAATLGATELQQFFGIAIPNLRKSLLSGLMMVAAISVGEFGLSNLLTSFQSRTYPVVLWQASYGATGFACAATVILIMLASTAAFISYIAIKKS